MAGQLAEDLALALTELFAHRRNTRRVPYVFPHGTAIGGEAALRAGMMLKQNILALASAVTQTPADALTIAGGEVINTRIGQAVISLADVGRPTGHLACRQPPWSPLRR